jgi:hypothetical protein
MSRAKEINFRAFPNSAPYTWVSGLGNTLKAPKKSSGPNLRKSLYSVENHSIILVGQLSHL